MRRLSAIPISARLTVAFAAAMAVVLAVTSAWVYQRQVTGSQETIDRRLEDRVADVQVAVRDDDAGRRPTADEYIRADSGAMQVYDRDGGVVASSAILGKERIVDASDIRSVGDDERWTDVRTNIAAEGQVRVLYQHVRDSEFVIAVVESEDARHEALEKLAAQLVGGNVIAVLLGSLLAFSLARAALRPVEALRRGAEQHGHGSEAVVLPVPAARDEVSRLATTLNELLHRMHEATLHERRFVAEAGHELRTPLATMLAEIELALETTPAGDDTAATLRSLHEEATRLSSLAERLLQLTTAGERADRAEHDLADLVRARAARYGTAFPDVEIEVQAPRAVPVLADRGAVTQAVDNLIDNAIVHGGARIDVRISERHGAIEVRVVDDGDGIDPDIAERAFERFARSADARTRRGAGLGLSIVQSVADLHGGTAGIEARSDGAAGTEAWFTIARTAGA